MFLLDRWLLAGFFISTLLFMSITGHCKLCQTPVDVLGHQ